MKKIFYNKRHKVPIWSQVYLVWFVLFLTGILWIAKMEIVKPGADFTRFYDYNKEYDKISKIHLKTLNQFPDMHEYNKTLINQINADIKESGWNLEEVDYNYRSLKCKFVRYFADKEKTGLIVFFNNDNILNSVNFLHTFASAVIGENLRSISIISVQGSPACLEYALKKNEQNNTENTRYLNVSTGTNKSPSIQLENSHGIFSSILWSSITPDSMVRPSLTVQMAQTALPLFQNLNINRGKISPDTIRWKFSGEMKNEVNLIHSVLPPLMFTLKNYPKIAAQTAHNSFWLGKQSAISKRGATILSCLLVLLIWLPVANRLYNGESVNHIIRSFFSVIYTSLPFFIAAGLLKILGLTMPVSTYASLIVFAVFFVLLWFFNRIQKSMFNFDVNTLTEFSMLNIFASVFAFNNISLFVFLMPSIFVTSKKSAIDFSLFKFFLAATLLLTIFAMYFLGAFPEVQNLAARLSPIWIEQTVFSGLISASLFFFLAGSFFRVSQKTE